MKELSFRLNPYPFVRNYSDGYYLENQVSHMRAFLPKDKFEWLESIGIHNTLSSIYEILVDSVEIEKTMLQLHKAWLIDIIGIPVTLERRFSYAHKAEIEHRFGDYPFIGIKNESEVPCLINLQIELTDVCNEHCIHCYLPNEKKDKGNALSVEQVIEILQQFRAMNGLKVVFSGGEILLHANLFEILEECKRLNLMILLQSNLLSLTEANLKKIKELDVFNVQVSLYSTDEQIHELITRRKGSFERTKRNIEMLVKNDIPAMISCPVMSQNVSTVRSLHKYAQSLGVDVYFDFMMMAECNGKNDNLSVRINLEQTKDMLQFRIDSQPKFIEAIANSNTLAEALSKRYARRRTMCDILSASLCIDSDGTVYPCPGWNGMKMGNIASSSIKNIWLSEQANKLRAINIDEFATCKSCDLYNFCDMCAVYNFNENGDVYSACSRFCEMAKILKECVIKKYFQLH